MYSKALLIVGLAVILAGCKTIGDDADFKGDETQDMRAAVTSPVNDVGLIDIEIPDYLAEMTNPYAAAPTSCQAVNAELSKLNDLLGDDLDVPENVAEEREQRALNATSDTLGSVLIPFRGVVRAISGAAKNEREARIAYQRGLVRRAYIKGLTERMGCPTVRK